MAIVRRTILELQAVNETAWILKVEALHGSEEVAFYLHWGDKETATHVFTAPVADIETLVDLAKQKEPS